MKTLIAIFVMLFSSISWATLTVGTNNCPTQFEGRVKEIIEPVGSEDSFSTKSVVFENQHNLKGDAKDQMVVEVLQNGPFKIEKDKEYQVKLRNGKVCWIEEI